MSEFFFQPSIAPGREGQPAPAPAPQTTQPAPQPAPQGDGQQGPGSIFGGSTILFLALPLLLLFFMTRSQSKKQHQIESSLKVGDRVVSRSGLIGKIEEVGERTLKVEIAPGVKVQMLKSSIEGLDGGDKAAADKDKDAKDKDKDAKDKESPKSQEKKA